jgi:MFS family permease
MYSKPSTSKTFRDLIIYRVSSTISYQMMMIAVGWHIFEITHDVVALGLVGLAELIPYFLCALYAGHAVDYYSRKWIAFFACLLHVIVGIFLMLIAFDLLHPAQVLIYIGVAFLGIGRALLRPSYQSLFGELIPREETPKYSAYASSAFQACVVVGPAIAGVLIGLIGLEWTYFISGFAAVFGMYSILFIREKKYTNTEGKDNFLKSFMAGLSYVKNHHLLLATMSLDMLAVLFGGAVSMLPAFVKEVLHAGPEALGILRAAPAIGSMLTAVYLARNPILRHSGRYMIAAVAGFGLSIIGFSLSETLFWSTVFLALTGFFDAISVVVRSAVFQLTTPDQMRGRVSAINGIFVGSSNELGALESGLAASLMGLVPSIAFGGAVTLLVAVGTYYIAPSLRKMHLKDLIEQ